MGILLAPALAELPDAARWTAGGALLIAGLAAGIHSRRRKAWAGAAGAALAAALCILLAPALSAMPDAARRTLAVAAITATWWVTVAIPIPATSLLPLVLFPALGVLPSGKVATSYANNNIFLFMGGFILALGIQRWGLHRRIALLIVSAIGSDPSRMVLGFMIASAFLSMWISNTATTLMMLPLALAVIAALGSADAESFPPALLLGTAYGASIGGLATPIGTPPNISFQRILEILYEAAPSFSFGHWTLAFFPLVALFLPLAWIVLTRVSFPLKSEVRGRGRQVMREELRRLGPMGSAERRMLWLFAITAGLWISRGDLAFGGFTIPGWAGILERWIGPPFVAANLHDATVAVTMAIVAFIVPGEPDTNSRRRALMDWETARELPWGILLLFGGGFALALAFKESGLSLHLGEIFGARLEGLPAVVLVAATCLLLTFLTELTSNTATTEVMLPVLAGTAGALAIHPLLLMLPATLSASCAFMLPVATPPNAIVFGSGKIEMRHMIRAGIVLNLLGVMLITAVFLTLSSGLLGIDLTHVPTWAAPP